YVIGGGEVSISDHPHQASLEHVSEGHRCGASVIGINKIVTAAHCTQESAGSYVVRAGTSTRGEGGQVIPVLVIVNHPDYCASCSGFPNDISVLTLSYNFELGSNVQPIELTSTDHTGESCPLTGWGFTHPTGTLATVLHGVDIEVLSNIDCNIIMDAIPGIHITDGQVCVYDWSQASGGCTGDAGGPLQCDGELTGVQSWVISSRDICRQDFPSVSTRVSYYRDWILSQ
ncbi:hypothetical protein CAPTEDRAFT_94302, partial [Capitella teleta]